MSRPVRAAIVDLVPPSPTRLTSAPPGIAGWRRISPTRLWTVRTDVVVIAADIESPAFPIPRLAALARRHRVLVVSPTRMRSGIDTAQACGVRGYAFADDTAAHLATALEDVAAGGEAWPVGWRPTLPTTEPPTPRGPGAPALVTGLLALPVGLLGLRTSLGIGAAVAELAAATALGWAWRCRAGEEARLVHLAVQRARAAERGAFSRALHDRTLQTLEMLAAHADIDDGDLRVHLDDEARWLRGLVESGVDAGPTDLVEAISSVVRRLSRPALTVTFDHARAHRSPPLPAPVVAAIAGGVTEALTNVAKHAGVDRATVSLSRRRHTVTVEVTDRGRGIGDPTARYRFGIRHSIRDRMAEVGGTGEVRAGDRGTIVRLTYPVVNAPSSPDARLDSALNSGDRRRVRVVPSRSDAQGE